MFYKLFNDIKRALPAGKQPASFGHFIYILHSPSFEQEVIDIEVGFMMSHSDVRPIPLSSGRKLAMRELAGVDTMASIVAENWHKSGLNRMQTVIDDEL